MLINKYRFQKQKYRILFLSNKNSFVSRKNSGEFVDDVASDVTLGLAVVVALAAAGDDADLVVVGCISRMPWLA